jgi:hypothetical protein
MAAAVTAAVGVPLITPEAAFIVSSAGSPVAEKVYPAGAVLIVWL